MEKIGPTNALIGVSERGYFDSGVMEDAVMMAPEPGPFPVANFSKPAIVPFTSTVLPAYFAASLCGFKM